MQQEETTAFHGPGRTKVWPISLRSPPGSSASPISQSSALLIATTR
jgi:hypothetical protein